MKSTWRSFAQDPGFHVYRAHTTDGRPLLPLVVPETSRPGQKRGQLGKQASLAVGWRASGFAVIVTCIDRLEKEDETEERRRKNTKKPRENFHNMTMKASSVFPNIL